jgi:hypothetical protein
VRSKQRNLDIDLGLAVLCIITPPGVSWTMRDIADICGCTKTEIETIQRSASRKFLRVAKARHLYEFLQD